VSSSPACSISVTFVSEKDGSETTVKAPIGKHLLEVAHDNDVELEGASSSTSTAVHAAQQNTRTAAPCRLRHVPAATAQQQQSAVVRRVCVVTQGRTCAAELLGRLVASAFKRTAVLCCCKRNSSSSGCDYTRTPSTHAVQVWNAEAVVERQQHCRHATDWLACCVAGACEASLACSTCHVIVEVRGCCDFGSYNRQQQRGLLAGCKEASYHSSKLLQHVCTRSYHMERVSTGDVCIRSCCLAS
jgi:hypothetical protein